MTDQPTPALRVLIGAESAADAPAALRLATILAAGGPAVFGGLLVIDEGVTDPRAMMGRRIVTASGQLMAMPEASRLQKLVESETRAFRGMLAETAERAGGRWANEVASGTLGSSLAASAGAWDVTVIGHRALHRWQGAIVFLTAAGSVDSEVHEVATKMAAKLHTETERLHLPEADEDSSGWLADRLNRLNAAAVVLDAVSTPLDGFRHLTALLSVARCPIVVLRSARVQPRLEHSAPDPAAARSANMSAEPHTSTLRRAVTLPLLVFYGLGVTIGAGIYVLIGETVAVAGIYAPASFLFAALIMAFSAGSFCELSGRYPQSAGEAIYVEAGFARPVLTLLTGGLIVVAAMISAAAIAVGGTGYIMTLVPLPKDAILIGVILCLGVVAGWGIVESVTFAAVFTVIEILGLLALVLAGYWAEPDLINRLPEVLPPLSDATALSAVFSASLLAFFAFIGFDDVVNLAEEVRNPRRNLPIGIVATLVIATLLYFAVASVAVLTVPLDDLAGSGAPISLIFGHLTDSPPYLITMIAIVATLNGIVILIVMASRVIYGLGEAGRIPAALARVNPVTRTPLVATSIVTAAVLVLAVWFPLGLLAERATQAILVVFALVNAALLRIHWRGDPAPERVVRVPRWIPVLGLLGCLVMLIGPFFL